MSDVTSPEKESPAETLDATIVVPVVERFDDLEQLYLDFSAAVARVTDSFEFIFVVDASQVNALPVLKKMVQSYSGIRVYGFNGYFGEATALDAGFASARGRFVFTLASYYQVVPEAFETVYRALMNRSDLVVSRRHPRVDSSFNRAQSGTFHYLSYLLSGYRFHDVSCGFRGMRRELTQEIPLYGDLHRFLAALAMKRGYRVTEVAAPQHPQDARTRIHRIADYAHRLLDLMNLFFLMKFTKRPLRFFGAIGSSITAVGFALCAYLTVLRLFYGQALADRPLLVLGTVLLVAGIQTVAIGLIGEIIVYTHARESRDYHIEAVFPESAQDKAAASAAADKGI